MKFPLFQTASAVRTAFAVSALTLAAAVQADGHPWKQITEANGDLNRDGKADKVVVEQMQNPKNIIKNDGLGSKTLNTNPRRLRVMLAEKGGWRTVSEARWLPPEHDAETPCLTDPLYDGGINVEKGILSVNLNYFLSCGSWTVSNHTFKYRYQNGRMVLIGADGRSHARNGGYGTGVSINFPTRKITATGFIQIFDAKSHTENGGRLKKQQSRFAKLKAGQPVYLENKPADPYDLLQESDKRVAEWLYKARY
ncbi:hypothetical protein [Neisseria sp.]|uniref:hypothetical protein n=1 Tax=Neisseria sp. TaxID=192066 RepID=UPI0035A02229